MSATVAAALKKIAVAVLTDKKLRRTVLGIVLGVIIIIIMPVAAVIFLFNGDIEIDTDRLQTLVVENLSAEEKAKLQAVEDTMYAIETAMTEKGFTAEKAKEAQVLYVLALSDDAEQTDFVSKLAGCFTEDQTDEQLIAAVNSAFGTELKTEDYSKIMNSIRAKAINVSKFVDPETKNNVDLAEWAKQAYAKKWGYVYGTYGEVLTESILTTRYRNSRNRSAITRNSFVGIGSEAAPPIASGSSKAMHGLIVTRDKSNIAPTVFGIPAPTPCSTWRPRKVRLIRCPTSPASPYGWTDISASMSAAGKPFMLRTRSWVLS